MTVGVIEAVACAASISAAEAERPNVVLIMTDDQGWGDVRSHGNERIDTPAHDRLASEGARFDRFYVSPVCAPTRASLLSGRYHLRSGVHGVTRAYETMRSEEVTIAEILRSAGYATGCFGKWHNGFHFPYHPNGQGFEEFVGFCGGHWTIYFDTRLEHNGRPIATTGYIAYVLTDVAISFIRTNRDRPFFCYLPYNTPHSPFQVPIATSTNTRPEGWTTRSPACAGWSKTSTITWAACRSPKPWTRSGRRFCWEPSSFPKVARS
ncbi:MAG: hypothetical protein A2V98_26020 [Planctomycetes bacterium RBG_16_64_12]|nr:MAG: hypothetical protein A2V98_26020 [Planctomycetes bacterium RBG_16_64_12]